MNTKTDDSDLNTPIVLDPEFSVKGMIQRMLLTEALQPDAKGFDPSQDLKVMRTFKRVLDNRMQHSELYNARNAKDERDILLAPRQFPEFKEYPKNFPAYADDAVINANKKERDQSAYRQHVLNAIQVSNEIVDPAQTEFPTAVSWYQEGKPPKNMGNVYLLGIFGGTKFYAPDPASSPHAKHGQTSHDPTAGMTPVEKLRYYAAQARADAAAKPVPEHMKLYHMVQTMVENSRQTEHSYAPIPGRPAMTGKDHRRDAAAFSHEIPMAHSVLTRSLAPLSQKHQAAEPASIHAGQSQAPMPGPREDNLSAAGNGSVFDLMETIRHRVMENSAVMQLYRGGGFGAPLPSIAPRHGASQSFHHNSGHDDSETDAHAPHGAASGHHSDAGQPARRHHLEGAEHHHAVPAHAAAAKHALSQYEVEKHLRNLLEREARRPPSGPTGFNPSLTPAWAGLKIPG